MKYKIKSGIFSVRIKDADSLVKFKGESHAIFSILGNSGSKYFYAVRIHSNKFDSNWKDVVLIIDQNFIHIYSPIKVCQKYFEYTEYKYDTKKFLYTFNKVDNHEYNSVGQKILLEL